VGLENSTNQALYINPCQGEQCEVLIIETLENTAVRSQKTGGIPDPSLHKEESIEEESQSPASSSGSSTSSSVSRCECSYIPTFARAPSPPIRLLKNSDLTDCIHFVAVSYCWQSSLPP
jgi:hypothetical protein